MSSRSERVRAVLEGSDLFAGLAAADLDNLASIGRTKTVKASEAVFRKGADATQLYAVLAGHLKVLAPSRDGREMVLRLLDPGVVFGEIALLDGGTRTASVVATEDSELLVIDRRDLLDLLRRRPEVAVQLLSVVARRLRATTEQVEDTAFLGLAPRLAKKLLELASRYGRRDETGVHIERRLSQEELGTLVGTSRVSINQQLKAWEREGFVRTARGALCVTDVEALARIADD